MAANRQKEIILGQRLISDPQVRLLLGNESAWFLWNQQKYEREHHLPWKTLARELGKWPLGKLLNRQLPCYHFLEQRHVYFKYQYFAHDLTPSGSLEALRGVMTWHPPAWTPLPEHTHSPLLSDALSCESPLFLPLGPCFPPCSRGRHTHLRTLSSALHSSSVLRRWWSPYPVTQARNPQTLHLFPVSAFTYILYAKLLQSCLFVTLWTIACQASLSMGVSRTLCTISFIVHVIGTFIRLLPLFVCSVLRLVLPPGP